MPNQAVRNDPPPEQRTSERAAGPRASGPTSGFGRLSGVLARFRTDRSGVTAIEFALVAGPFVLLLFSILELALIFIVNTGLSTSTATLAKQIRTGQIQAPGLSSTTSSGTQLDLSDARTQLCGQIQIVPQATCLKQLQLDVRPITSFQQMAAASPVSGSTFDSSSLCYYSGNAGDIVEMRAYYLYGFFNPVLLAVFSNISSYVSGTTSSAAKYFLIQTVQVFKTESYASNSNTGAGC